VELDDSREARSLLETRNGELAGELRRSRAEVRNLQELLITTPLDTVTVTATDTFLIESSVGRVDFVLPFNAGTVTGYTLTPPPRASGVLDLNPISIQVVTSELPDGSWQLDVTLPPPYELGALATFVNPRRPTWWERHDFEVGLGLGATAAFFIVALVGG